MHFTYVIRPGEAPEGRGPNCDATWESPFNYCLRIGYILQLVSFLGITILMKCGTSSCLDLLGFFKVTPESTGSVPIGLVVALCGINLVGLVCQMAFITITDDDGSIKQSRGFRAGTKMLAQGNSMAAFSSMLTLMSFFAANRYFTDMWMQKEIGSEANWLLYGSGRMADVIALLLLAGSSFFMEGYHSEGAGEVYGWVIAISYRLAAVSEFAYLMVENSRYSLYADVVYTISLGLALVAATVWSFQFEPISHRYDVKFTQSAMRTEYYKSRNAMAYYGPAVVDADGELDMQPPQVATGCATGCERY